MLGVSPLHYELLSTERSSIPIDELHCCTMKLKGRKQSGVPNTVNSKCKLYLACTVRFEGYSTISLQNSKFRMIRFREMLNMSNPKKTVRLNAKNTCTMCILEERYSPPQVKSWQVY